MLKVELNKKTENPFYGMRHTLEFYQNASKGQVSVSSLNNTWNEVKETKEGREMFFSILFSVGDITARQHNIFGKSKIDSGGTANRASFQIILNWLRDNNYSQFKKFLFANLFNEYTSFDTILTNRVKTTKNKNKVESVTSSLSGHDQYLGDLSDFVVGIIKGSNPSNKHFLAKFLTRPRMSKRKGHKTMLPETRLAMKNKENFLKMVSDKAGLSYIVKATHIEFVGYYTWRKEYLGDLESILFASKKVLEFDKQEFLDWLDKMPASARHRVRCRLLTADNKPKQRKITSPVEGNKKKVVTFEENPWKELPSWFLHWENFKETKQTEQRVLEEKVRQGVATQDDEAKLQTVKKEAKVTVGAVNFVQMFTDIVKGTIDKVKVQPFLDKIKLPYNSLVFVDDSGSMRSMSHNGISAFEFATFMATICLTKNPDDVGRSLIGFYSREARLYSTMTSRSEIVNTILRSTPKKINEQLIDPNKHFLENLKRIREFANSVMTSNGTDIASIPNYLATQIRTNPSMIEQLQAFPVWTIISDGNWNNMSSPEASINDFMRKCEMFFGFKPFIIAIDVASNSSANVTRFSGIDNFMFIPPNPAQIEQLLTNFKEMDIMDVYTPLLSLHRSNRYQLVRNSTI